MRKLFMKLKMIYILPCPYEDKNYGEHFSSCKAHYGRLRDSDRTFCHDMFHGLEKHCMEILKELDTKITFTLSKLNSQLHENHQKNNGTVVER